MKLTQAEQDKVKTLITLFNKECRLSDKLSGLFYNRHDSSKNLRTYEKLEAQREKVFQQFAEKFKNLPQHAAGEIETMTGYNWEDLQEEN
jgi:hypothetical protein